jgi:hypothetical protein
VHHGDRHQVLVVSEIVEQVDRGGVVDRQIVTFRGVGGCAQLIAQGGGEVGRLGIAEASSGIWPGPGAIRRR